MYITLLVLHMFGLTIGAGTGFYLAAVGRHAARNLEQAEARVLMPGIAGTISRVGTVGLIILILSGIGMLLIRGGGSPGALFNVKMALVAAIVVFVGTMQVLARRVRRAGDANAAMTMKKIALIGPVLAVLTLVAAVMAFH